jgi:soluble cytochrome b562
MKKSVVILFVAMFVLTLVVCKGGGGKYGDVKSVMDKFISAQEKFAGALENAKSADDVVAALKAITETTKTLAPKMKEFETKYPEFKDQQNPPAELKPLMDRMMAVGTKMMGLMEKITQYASDPKVQEAQQKYQEAMGLMR